MTSLAVFDIDGTMLQTSAVDDACYLRAVGATLGITGFSVDWGSYRHSTDGAILAELVEVHRGTPVTPEEIAATRACFVNFLEEASREEPRAFRPTAGLEALLAALPRRTWRAAIATGGWRASACFKLRAAGIDTSAIPAAYADDDPSREGIMRTAVARAAQAYQVDAFDRVVYVGDGTWDLRASARCGIPFVGLAGGARAARLRALGATHVHEDFSAVDEVIRSFDTAPVATLTTGT